jgi:peptidoglycan/LPS O-acetylase OafA/YrhL
MNRSSLIHYDYIDTLRGLAIMGVVFIHVSQVINPTHEITTLIAESGSLGVQLFFVASAITLFLSLESRTKAEAHPL